MIIKQTKIGKTIYYFLLTLVFVTGVNAVCSAMGMKHSNISYTEVMTILNIEPSLDESNITVAIKDNGIVVLGGKVESYAEKCLAEEAVEKIVSVKGVANEIEVELLYSYKKNDVEIIEMALSTLKWQVFIPHERIKIAVANGYVTLTGDVDFGYQKKRAEYAIKDLYGVISVTNNITIKATIS
ncbi:MAG: BON domain-containing protein [Flavobacteriales bacterium]|nr:BON domain-containing protein [Flavobacteriales bacterium]